MPATSASANDRKRRSVETTDPEAISLQGKVGCCLAASQIMTNHPKEEVVREAMAELCVTIHP